MFSALFLRNLEGCSEALVNRASQGACPEVIYPRGFRGISPTGGKLEKPRGESAGASTKRGSLKPAYLGHLQVGCSEVLVNRVSPDTLPGDPLFTRSSEPPFCPLPQGAAFSFTGHVRGSAPKASYSEFT